MRAELINTVTGMQMQNPANNKIIKDRDYNVPTDTEEFALIKEKNKR